MFPPGPRSSPLVFFPPALAQVGGALTTRIPGSVRGEFLVGAFPNGELTVKVVSTVHGRDVIVVAALTPPAERFIHTLYLIDTLQRCGARSIELVVPYLAYARHDRGEPGVGQMFFFLGRLLLTAGVQRVTTLDIHHPAASVDFEVELDSLPAAALFATRLRGTPFEQATIVAPDDGARERAQALARELGIKTPIVQGQKQRSPDGVTTEFTSWSGSCAVIVDDILDTGGTLLAAAHFLRQSGVQRMIICVTHALFTGTKWRGLWDLGVERIYTTDSVGTGAIPADERIEIIPCSASIAESVAPRFE
jgi:ribose-phosphate pyrophosphokinase